SWTSFGRQIFISVTLTPTLHGFRLTSCRFALVADFCLSTLSRTKCKQNRWILLYFFAKYQRFCLGMRMLVPRKSSNHVNRMLKDGRLPPCEAFPSKFLLERTFTKLSILCGNENWISLKSLSEEMDFRFLIFLN